MEVGKIQQINISKIQTQGQKKVAFGSAHGTIESSKVKDAVIKKMPDAAKRMIKLKWLKGEVGGILITAIGTGIVAPIFIAFNPLSDKDENTKKYTAMRQPVSAVLAILIQLGLLKPLESIYDTLSNKGKLGKSVWFNQEKLHSKSFYENEAKRGKLSAELVEAKVERQMANDVDRVAGELHQNGSIKFENNTSFDGKNLGGVINAALEERIKTQQTIFNDSSDETKVAAKAKRAFVLLTEENRKDGAVNVIEELCKDLLDTDNQSKEKIHDILTGWKRKYGNNPELNKIAEEFLGRTDVPNIKGRAEQTLDKINIFKKALSNSRLIQNNSAVILEHLNNLKAGTDINIVPEGLKNLLNIDNADVGGLSNMLDTIKKTTDNQLRNKYIDKFITRVNAYIEAGDDIEKILEIYQKGYYTDTKDTAKATINLLNSLKVDETKEISDVKAVIRNIANKLGLSGNDKFEIEIVKELRNKIEKKIKGFSQVSNILVGLFVTLPITCNILNWVYPRFMDIFFPQLANSKKSEAPEEKVGKGGHK